MQHPQGTVLKQVAPMLPPNGALAPSATAQRQCVHDSVQQQGQGSIDGKNSQQQNVAAYRVTTASSAAGAVPTETQPPAKQTGTAAAPDAASNKNGNPVPAPESSYCFGPSGKKEKLRRIQITGDTTWVIPQRFRFLKRIGSGAYGCVASFEEAGENGGTRVAVKKIGDLFRDLVDAKRILREIKILKALKHENLIDLMEILDPLSPDFEDIYLVSDLMDTDLHRVIYSRQPLTHEHHQYFLYQILLAVAFLHEADVIHRDLKPSNVLVNLNCDVKICDFGLARGVSVPGKSGRTRQIRQQQQERQQDAMSSSGRLGDSQMSAMDTDVHAHQAVPGRPSNASNKNVPCTRLVGNSSIASFQREAIGAPASETGDLELTDYVVTRWYRPPELLIFPFHYSKPVDIWSVGCIMAELLGRRALFAGKDQYDQLRRIVKICGSPSAQDLSFLAKEAQEGTGGRHASKRRMRINRQFIEQLPASEGICFSLLFPDACPQALDLLRRLLAFNPSKRITALEALRHPYFRGLYCQDDEPKAIKPMDWSFDNFVPTKRLLQNLIYKEIISFHPDIAVRDRSLLHSRGVSTQQLLPLLPCLQGTALLQSDQSEQQQQKQKQQEREQQQQHNSLGHRSCCSAPAASTPHVSQEDLMRQHPLATAAAAPVAVSSAAVESGGLVSKGLGLPQQLASFCSAALSLHAQKQQQQQLLLQGFHLNNGLVHHQLLQQRRQSLLKQQQQSPYCPLQQEQQQQRLHAAATLPRHSIGTTALIRGLAAPKAPAVSTAPNIRLQRLSHHHRHLQQQQQQQQQRQQQQYSPRLYNAASASNEDLLRQATSTAATDRPACSPLQHNLRSLPFSGSLQRQQQVGGKCCSNFCCESRSISVPDTESLLLSSSASGLVPQHHTSTSTAAATDAEPRSSGSAAARATPQQLHCNGNDSRCCNSWLTTGSRNSTRSSTGEDAAFVSSDLHPQQQHQQQQQQLAYLHQVMEQQMVRQHQLIEQQKSQQHHQFPQDQPQQLHFHNSPVPLIQPQGTGLHVVPDYGDTRGDTAAAAAAAAGYMRWVLPTQHQQQQQQRQHYSAHN